MTTKKDLSGDSRRPHKLRVIERDGTLILMRDGHRTRIVMGAHAEVMRRMLTRLARQGEIQYEQRHTSR